MMWARGLLVILLTALPTAAQVRCTSYTVGGFLVTDCDGPPRPVAPLDPRAGVVDQAELERLRVLQLQRRVLEQQLDRGEPCPESQPGHPRLCR